MTPPMRDVHEFPRYPVPWRMVGGVVWALARGEQRSFAQDAGVAVTELGCTLEVRGAANVPAEGSCVIACNHYGRPGFGAWWVAMAISGVIAELRAPGANREVSWVMTGAWTFPESQWRRRHLTPLTRRLFHRIAAVYGFISMPPMPPDPAEMGERAAAVLRTVRLARALAPRGGMIGLAPEGMDSPGALGRPPTGAGRFIGLIVEAGMPLVPVGLAESRGRLGLSFGPALNPDVPRVRSARDRAISGQVMRAISDEVAKL